MKIINIEFKDKNSFKQNLTSTDIPLSCENILVQVFSGNLSTTNMLEILGFIKELIPNGVTIGATSAYGEFIEDKALNNSIIVSICYFEKSTLKIAKIDDNGKNSKELGERLAQKFDTKNLKVIISYVEGKYNCGGDFLRGFSSVIGDDVYILGGLAGDNFEDKQSYVLYENEVLKAGGVAVGIYSKNLFVDAKYAFDWDTMDKEFTVEKADKNVLKQINGTTPKDLYTKYFGENLEKNISLVATFFPFITKRNGYKTSNFLVSVDSDGYFHYNANIFEGEKVTFGIVNKCKIMQNLINLHNDLEKNCESIFIFSSRSRGIILDNTDINEVKYFSKLAPTCGLFTYGQFFKKPNEEHIFFQQTLVTLTLSENPTKRDVEDIENMEFTYHEAILNLINTVSRENNNMIENLSFMVQSQKRELEKKDNTIQQETYNDSLTKLKNRKSLLIDKDRLNPYAIYLIDIQSFSEINDLYGEKIGDILLQKVANFILEYLKYFKSRVYRLHGDTFAVLSTNQHKKSTYNAIIMRFIKTLESQDFSFKYNNLNIDFALHVRVGIALIEDCMDSSNIIENADMALKYAKKNKQDFSIYDPSFNIEKSYKNELQTVRIIKEALQDDRIIPYFQPIFKNNHVNYESLIRLKLKDGTILTPYHFLDIAKNTRLYYKLTKKMIEKTFAIFENKPYMFSINFSYLDIQNDKTIPYLRKMLKKHHIKNKLVIEILESETFENYDVVLDFIKSLKEMGILIAIDDFGSGYSNFSHLIKLDPDYIKIDGSLIKNIDTDYKSYTVTKAIASFAKDMRIKTIAEFIHSEEVYEKVKSLDIDGYQGFLLGKPKSAEETFGEDLKGTS